MDVLEDKEDKYNVLFYCKSDLRTGKAAKTWHQLKLELDKGRLPIRHMFQNTRDMQPDWQK